MKPAARATCWPSPARRGYGSTTAALPFRADTVADRLPAPAWQRYSAGNGAKGPRYYDWAWIHTGTGEHHHLLVRRNRTTGELAFYLCWSPAAVTLEELVRVAGVRWSVEECFQAAKGQVGLDHYQVRHWISWHRHITLAMLALAFLTALATDAAPQRPADVGGVGRGGSGWAGCRGVRSGGAGGGIKAEHFLAFVGIAAALIGYRRLTN